MPLELINPLTKATIFKIQTLDSAADFEKVSKYNCFGVILILNGQGTLTADVSSSPFSVRSLITLSLYQPFSIHTEGAFRAMMINFNAEFFCLHKHRNEVSCNGVLFNNIYESPVLPLLESEAHTIQNIFEGIRSEMGRADKPDPEVVISYLKILLIDASRFKVEKRSAESGVKSKDPEILIKLRSAIEQYFRSKHSPAEYADLLSITPSALNRVSKTHFNKTLSALIAERLITESKRELYLTAKPVKQIAYELGFSDEFYFSRYFKNNVGISPQYFRDTVGFDKAGS